MNFAEYINNLLNTDNNIREEAEIALVNDVETNSNHFFQEICIILENHDLNESLLCESLTLTTHFIKQALNKKRIIQIALSLFMHESNKVRNDAIYLFASAVFLYTVETNDLGIFNLIFEALKTNTNLNYHISCIQALSEICLSYKQVKLFEDIVDQITEFFFHMLMASQDLLISSYLIRFFSANIDSVFSCFSDSMFSQFVFFLVTNIIHIELEEPIFICLESIANINYLSLEPIKILLIENSVNEISNILSTNINSTLCFFRLWIAISKQEDLSDINFQLCNSAASFLVPIFLSVMETAEQDQLCDKKEWTPASAAFECLKGFLICSPLPTLEVCQSYLSSFLGLQLIPQNIPRIVVCMQIFWALTSAWGNDLTGNDDLDFGDAQRNNIEIPSINDFIKELIRNGIFDNCIKILSEQDDSKSTPRMKYAALKSLKGAINNSTSEDYNQLISLIEPLCSFSQTSCIMFRRAFKCALSILLLGSTDNMIVFMQKFILNLQTLSPILVKEVIYKQIVLIDKIKNDRKSSFINEIIPFYLQYMDALMINNISSALDPLIDFLTKIICHITIPNLIEPFLAINQKCFQLFRNPRCILAIGSIQFSNSIFRDLIPYLPGICKFYIQILSDDIESSFSSGNTHIFFNLQTFINALASYVTILSCYTYQVIDSIPQILQFLNQLFILSPGSIDNQIISLVSSFADICITLNISFPQDFIIKFLIHLGWTIQHLGDLYQHDSTSAFVLITDISNFFISLLTIHDNSYISLIQSFIRYIDTIPTLEQSSYEVSMKLKQKFEEYVNSQKK